MIYNFKNTDNQARIILELATEFGWDANVDTIIQRIKTIEKGVVQEDELIFLLNWGKKCRIIHKTDQGYVTKSQKEKFKIPDLLVQTEVDGDLKTFFIEVKTSKDNKLSWSEKYYNGLLEYSEVTKIPILVAWKWTMFDIWSIFPIEDFKKGPSNFKIDFEKAMKKSVFSKYFGDYFISLPDEFGFHIRYKKHQLEEANEDSVTWTVSVDKAYFTGRENTEIESKNLSVLALFFACLLKKKFLRQNII